MFCFIRGAQLIKLKVAFIMLFNLPRSVPRFSKDFGFIDFGGIFFNAIELQRLCRCSRQSSCLISNREFASSQAIGLKDGK